MQQPPNINPQFPQLQWQQPPMPPTKNKSLKGVCIVLILILAITLVGCSGSGTGGSTSTSTYIPTPTATTAAISQAIPTTAPTIATTDTPTQISTPVPTAKPTPIPTQKPIQQPVDPTANIPKVPGLGSENGPELGSPLSVFVTTFGPTTDNIWGIGGNDVSLAVDTTGSKVTFIFISTDDKVTWSKDQTKMIAFCSEFMPLDVATNGSLKQSSEFYSQNYTSSIGDFYMLINHNGGPGTWSCDMETGSN